MTRMLVVPSSSLSPLSTAVPLPTDGLPEWWWCERCDKRQVPGDSTPCVYGGTLEPDGPYPHPAAVWQEVRCKTPDACAATWCGEQACARGFGAVVATVEVTGPSHLPRECRIICDDPVLGDVADYCHPDALPDTWHTPTGRVTRLDVPIPMDRPTAADEHRKHPRIQDPCGPKCRTPAPWWWADLPGSSLTQKDDKYEE